MNNIYLDYAATSEKHFDILKECIFELENIYANPSSNHTLGKKNSSILKKHREHIAKSINANSNEIIFTSGGTEANNTVFHHISENFDGGDIIISNIEHSSIFECATKLQEKGFNIITIPTLENGIIDIEFLKNIISKNTVLISIMLANNETGILQPIKEISNLIKDKDILFHSDIVQAYGKVNIDVKELNLDFASVSAHKIGATNNFGFLYAKNNNITPFILGGGQENGYRSGTSDLLGVLALSKCYDYTINNIEHLLEIKKYLIEQLELASIKFEINGKIDTSLPNILNCYFENISSQRLITYLDANNIYISGGSACSSGNIKASKIITNIYNINRAEHSVRISIGFNTTKDMIDTVIAKIKTLEERILERGK